MAGFSGASGVPKKYVDDLVAQSTANFSTGGIAKKLAAVVNTNQGDTCYFDFYTDDSKHYKLFFGRNGNSGFQYYDGSTWETLWQHSMTNGYKLLLPWSNYLSGNITLTTPFPSGRYLCAIQFGDNGRFFHFFRKPATYASDEILSFNCGSAGNAIVTFSSASVINVQLPSGIYLKTIGAYTGINLATT